MFGDRERKRLVNELESKGVCRNKPHHLYVYLGRAGEEGKIIRGLGCCMCKTVRQAKALWSRSPLRSFYIFEAKIRTSGKIKTKPKIVKFLILSFV